MAAAGAFGVAALVWAAVALADDINCNGGGMQCNGTQFDDTITGSNKADGIKAKGGHDDVEGLKGNDVIDAGSVNDYVDGGPGDDKINGGDDSDQFIIGGLFGGSGDDTVQGGDGDDDVYGGTGKDVLVGGPGDDQLDGIDENLRKGKGAKAPTKDRFSCGPGFDTAIVDSKDKPPDDCEELVSR